MKDLSFGKKFLLFIVAFGSAMEIYWAVNDSAYLHEYVSLSAVLCGLMAIVIFCKKC